MTEQEPKDAAEPPLDCRVGPMTVPGCATGFVRPNFSDWMADKEAEYRMAGFGEKDAKEKAMSDWYTEAPTTY